MTRIIGWKGFIMFDLVAADDRMIQAVHYSCSALFMQFIQLDWKFAPK